MKPFDIFITYISWGSTGKIRPVLVIMQNKNSVSVFPITTQYERKSEAVQAKYFKINDWQQSGLDKQSYIDTSNVLDLSNIVLDKKTPIGQLTTNDKVRLLKFLI